MKKSIPFFLVVLMVFTLIPLSLFGVAAETVTDSQGVTYTLSDNSTYYIASGCDRYATEIVIPKGYNDLPIKEIGNEAFRVCTELASIEIPDTVTAIGEFAFSGCGLTNVIIPDSVTSIGDAAFSACKITSVKIPDSVTFIGKNPFRACFVLETITVADGNKYYHSSNNCLIETESKTLISGCMNSIIPDDGSVTIIGEYAFRDCKGLKEIKIPSSVTTIGELAFYCCEGLTSIEIPDSVTTIGERAFYECESLSNLVIGNSLRIIGSGAFYGCKELTNFEIPNSVTTIEPYAFFMCRGITSLVIPDSVTFIGEYAFFNCHGLISVVIPNSVITIEGTAFNANSNYMIDDIYCDMVEQPESWHKQWYSNVDQIHWHNCDCGETHPNEIMHDDGKWATTDEADIHKEGKKELRCTICGDLLDSDVIPEKHDYSEDWKSDENTHWHECSCGEKSNEATHDEAEWVTTDEADIDKEGKKELRCTVCGYVLDTEIIPAIKKDDPAKDDEPDKYFMLGDVNDNREIDSMDYILLKRAYFGTFSLDEDAEKRADVNANGEIDAMDYILLKRAYFGTYVIK